jgi:hypothetical protein
MSQSSARAIAVSVEDTPKEIAYRECEFGSATYGDRVH